MKSVAAALIFLSYSLQLISTQLITNFFLFLCVCMWRVCCTFKFFMICHIYYLLLLYLFSNVSQVCYDSFLNKFLDNDCKKVTLRKKDRCCLVFFFCRPQRRSQWRVLFLNVISSSPSNNVPREFRGYFCGKWKCARGCAWTVDVSEICVLGLTTSRFSWDFWNRKRSKNYLQLGDYFESKA